jgi:8-oxo-dGTP diphosphatase
MIYRRKVYKLIPERFEEFNAFFHTYLLPNQLKHGARLIGRWVTEEKNEIMAIWDTTATRITNELRKRSEATIFIV